MPPSMVRWNRAAILHNRSLCAAYCRPVDAQLIRSLPGVYNRGEYTSLIICVTSSMDSKYVLSGGHNEMTSEWVLCGIKKGLKKEKMA
jgi:hypothetical protein